VGAKANPNRRSDIAAALKRAKPNDMLSLEDLAFVYGTTKGPFVTAKKQMPGMPQPILQGTQHIYPARAALKAMLDFETRNDAAAVDISRRRDAILGTLTRDRHEEATSAHLPARELQILNRLAAEVEEREREQRAYIPAAEVARTAGEVFSALSEFMASLSNRVDPNGLLDPKLRTIIDTGGAEALLGFHKTLRLLLNADAVSGTPRTTPDRARKSRVRRKRT
jgi:hypothetical protein